MKHNIGIYIIANIESEKVYIGSTVGLRQRWSKHKYDLRKELHHNPHLQAAWDYYGEDAFEFGILEYVDDPEELHLAEQFWMDIYREEGYELYNYGLAARSPLLGRPVSEETRCRMSEAQKGHGHTEESCRKMSRSAKTRPPISSETRRKMSRAARGKPKTEEARRKMSEAKAGPYPAFIHRETGEIIPAGVNLSALCRERGLHNGHMYEVKNGEQAHCLGWMLLQED